MAGLWQTVRVFISSTFRDMHSERDWLVKRVFPALRERLEKYRVHLIDIDLRWGVTEQQAESGGALDVCLDQIDDCRPFFLGILGERYGFVSKELLERIRSKNKYTSLQHASGKSITELEILYGVLNDPEMYDHSFFCFRDPAFIDNVPTEKQSDLRAEDDESADKLKALKTAIERTPLPTPPFKDYPCEYAGLRINWRLAELELKDNEQHRQALEEVAKDGLVDPVEYTRLNSDQRDLVHRFGTVHLTGLEKFGERVQNWLWESIRRQLNLSDEPPTTTAAAVDPLDEERDFHDRFMESRLRVYVGRELIQQQMIDYATSNETVPCLLTGPSGSGKSAALAKFVQALTQSQIQNQKSKITIIPHFIGASPASTSLRQILRRFCLTLQQEFGFADEVEQDTQRLIAQWKDFLRRIPEDRRVLIVLDALNQMDETDNAQSLHWLPWQLPAQVKLVASCIADPVGRALLPVSNPTTGKSAHPTETNHEPVLNAFRHRPHDRITMQPLTDAERRAILRDVPSLSAKTLDEVQVRLLLSNPATENPLFLLVALEELRGFGSFEQLNRRIADFPREGETVTALFAQVIERLEQEFDAELVRRVLTLLASARRGLSEHELQELVALPDPRRQSKTANQKSDDLFPVLRQLRPYLLSRAGLIDFYHRNLFKAVRERFLPSEEQRRQRHGRLAEYFHTQDYWLESLEDQRKRAKTFPATPRPVNVRKVDELPWQLLQAADWQKSEQLLTDLAFLEAKTEAEMVFDLAADFSAAIGGMPADRPLLRILRLLEEALRRDIHFIARHPTTLFQCLWNSCWWYDCPQTPTDVEVPKNHSPKSRSMWSLAERCHWIWASMRSLVSFALTRRPPSLTLHALLNDWQCERSKRTRGAWLRSLCPPVTRLGDGPQFTFQYRGVTQIKCVAISPDGRRIVAGFSDARLCLWNADTGRELAQFGVDRGYRLWSTTGVAFLPDSQHVAVAIGGKLIVWDASAGRQVRVLAQENCVDCVAVSADGRQIVASSFDKAIRIWDTSTGEQVHVLRGHNRRVTSVALSVDGQFIASGSDDATVRIWDALTAQTVQVLRGHHDAVTSVAFFPDGHRLVTGSKDRTTRIWNVETGKQLSWRGYKGDVRSLPVNSVAVARDGRTVVSGCECFTAFDAVVHVWDAETGQEWDAFRGHDKSVTSVAISGDGRQVVSASDDGRVNVWDVRRGKGRHRLQGHVERITCLAISPDGMRVASGGGTVDLTGTADDETVRVWATETGREILVLRGHEDEVSSVVFFPDGRRLASASDDGTIRIWDTETGQELHKLRGHGGAVESIAVSPDGRRIASGGGTRHLMSAWIDNSVRLWDTETGAELRAMRSHEYGVDEVRFCRNGACIFSRSRDGTVRVSRTESGELVDLTASDMIGQTVEYPPRRDSPVAVLQGTETALEIGEPGHAMAWFPERLDHVCCDAQRQIWAGAVANRLFIFRFSEVAIATAKAPSADRSAQGTP